MAIECERKFLGVDFAELRRRLASEKALCEGAHFEKNSLWDLPDGSLKAQGDLLRLRSQRRGNGQMRYVLTFKRKLDDAGGCKLRDEREVAVEDGRKMADILDGLGYVVVRRYEKLREVWRTDDAEIVLDTLPFARIVEIECRPDSMEALAHRFGLERAQTSTDDYYSLYRQWCLEHGRQPEADFVFTDDEAHTLCEALEK